MPDEYLSIAIGKRGQNVRLASKLTGWHLDVKSETAYDEAMESGYNSLIALPGIGNSTADALYEKGFFSIDEIEVATIEDLTQIKGIGEETAKKLIAAARTAVIEREARREEEEKAAAAEAERKKEEEAVQAEAEAANQQEEAVKTSSTEGEAEREEETAVDEAEAEADQEKEEKTAAQAAGSESELETDMAKAPETLQPTETEGAGPQKDPV